MARWKPGAFRVTSLLAAALFAWLFVQMQFTPRDFCAGFGITATDGLILLARRASMLMLGFAVLLAQASGAPPSPLRRAVSISVAVTMAGFATMGIRELLRGALPRSVWAVVCVELAFAASFLALWWTERRGARATPGTAATNQEGASRRNA